ncbi:MAG: SRPBCC domain-containing protein [Candidatus Protistobacter heckmanni]|nr:SRPBCC domain-containing protein [Candidatus Protistobacter heckmanni]
MQDAERLAKWWGPDGFTNRFKLFEFRTGGRWVFTMTGPDGKSYPNESTFASVEPGRQVVVRHLSQPHFQLTITLEPSAGGTLLRLDQAFDNAVVAEALRHIVEPANEQNINRWCAELGLT